MMGLGSGDSIKPSCLSALQLDRAPTGPGIYAWYASIALSETDWQPRLQEGADVAGSDLTAALNDYVRAHQPGPIALWA
jgi:hypothetical protein